MKITGKVAMISLSNTGLKLCEYQDKWFNVAVNGRKYEGLNKEDAVELELDCSGKVVSWSKCGVLSEVVNKEEKHTEIKRELKRFGRLCDLVLSEIKSTETFKEIEQDESAKFHMVISGCMHLKAAAIKSQNLRGELIELL